MLFITHLRIITFTSNNFLAFGDGKKKLVFTALCRPLLIVNIQSPCRRLQQHFFSCNLPYFIILV